MAQVPWRPVWQQPVSEEDAAALLQRCITRMQKSAAASFVFPSTFTKSYNKNRRTDPKGISDGDNDFKGVAAGAGFAAEDGRLLQQSEVYRQLQVTAAALERQPQAQLLHIPGQHAGGTAAGGKGATEGQEEEQQQQKRTRTASPREHPSAAAAEEEERKDLRRSVLQVIKARGMLQLLPRHLENVALGVHLYLLRFLFRYVPEFHGVLLAFDKVKIIQPRTARAGAAATAATDEEETEEEAAEAAAPAGRISKRKGGTGRRNNIATTTGTTAAATAASASRAAADAASGMGYVVPDTCTGGGLLLFEVEVDCLVFIPKQNAMLIGRVLTVRPTHLRLLWLDVFSVVVEQQGIPPSYVYNQTDRVYVHRNGGPPIRSGAPICFKLLRYLGDDSDEDVLCLAGSLPTRAGEIFPSLQQVESKSSSSNASQLRGSHKQQLEEKEEQHGSSSSRSKKHQHQERKNSKNKHQQQVQQEVDLNEEDEKKSSITGSSSSSSGGIRKTEASAAEEMNREADGGRGGRPAVVKAEVKEEKRERDREKHKEKKKKGEEGRRQEQKKEEEKDGQEDAEEEEEKKKKQQREKAKKVSKDVKKEKQKGDNQAADETTEGVVGGTGDENKRKRKKHADSEKDKEGGEEKIKKKRKGKNTSASASAEEDEGIPETQKKK